jgi:hypothetical protein
LGEVDLLRASKVEQEVERPFPAVEAQVQLVGLALQKRGVEVVIHVNRIHQN